MKNSKDDMDMIFLSDSSLPDMESWVVRTTNQAFSYAGECMDMIFLSDSSIPTRAICGPIRMKYKLTSYAVNAGK